MPNSFHEDLVSDPKLGWLVVVLCQTELNANYLFAFYQL